jgi:hypothetical protein
MRSMDTGICREQQCPARPCPTRTQRGRRCGCRPATAGPSAQQEPGPRLTSRGCPRRTPRRVLQLRPRQVAAYVRARTLSFRPWLTTPAVAKIRPVLTAAAVRNRRQATASSGQLATYGLQDGDRRAISDGEPRRSDIIRARPYDLTNEGYERYYHAVNRRMTIWKRVRSRPSDGPWASPADARGDLRWRTHPSQCRGVP